MDTASDAIPRVAAKAPLSNLQKLQRLAETDFLDYFNALPSHQSLQFDSQFFRDESHREIGLWPKIVHPVALRLGNFDDGDDESQPEVYVFVHGEALNQIGYFSKPPQQQTIERLNLDEMITRTSLEEPFCDLGDERSSTNTIGSVLRPLVLFYFMAAGYITELVTYKAFNGNFKRACIILARAAEHNGADDSSQTRPVPAAAPIHEEGSKINITATGTASSEIAGALSG